eukprot:GCRY01004029.1.p1 GENE.GCRY01004029.1~~GCRY01004029.1.p1  ORF type:complete len:707 (+),score=61.37 GCRY01004029.1:177-2297(+)
MSAIVPNISTSLSCKDCFSASQRCSAYDVDSCLAELCELNAISKDEFTHRGNLVSRLDGLMLNYHTSMKPLQYFHHLRELTLIGHKISKIEYLEFCPFLERLCLCENNIESIEGLETLSSLKHLDLHLNRLNLISGLKGLSSLEFLDLSGNRIAHFSGLECCVNLLELNLADNLIEHGCSLLCCLRNLERLNLSGNQFSSFQEIVALKPLSQLKSLCFYDLNYPPSPLALLSNYTTHTLYHLRQLKELDRKPILQEHSQNAEATYLKKKMYYNMKIEENRRLVENVRAQAREMVNQSQRDLLFSLKLLLREQHILQSLLFLGKTEAACVSLSHEPDLKSCRDTLEQITSLIQTRENQRTNFESLFRFFTQGLEVQAQMEEGRLYQELSSGGNIRLEDGAETDTWHKSCVALVNARFYPKVDSPSPSPSLSGSSFFFFRSPSQSQDHKPVIRVTRILNRLLRQRYDAFLCALQLGMDNLAEALSSKSEVELIRQQLVKSSLHSSSVSPSPVATASALPRSLTPTPSPSILPSHRTRSSSLSFSSRLGQNGTASFSKSFDPPCSQVDYLFFAGSASTLAAVSAAGFSTDAVSGVALTNSVNVALCWAGFDCSELPSPEDMLQLKDIATLLVCKVHLGTVVNAKERFPSISAEPPALDRSQYPGADSVCSVCADNSKQRIWTVCSSHYTSPTFSLAYSLFCLFFSLLWL